MRPRIARDVPSDVLEMSSKGAQQVPRRTREVPEEFRKVPTKFREVPDLPEQVPEQVRCDPGENATARIKCRFSVNFIQAVPTPRGMHRSRSGASRAFFRAPFGRL